jgi:hypothetical protein
MITTEKLLDRNVAAPVYKTENTASGIRHVDDVAPSIRKSWQSLRGQEAVARSAKFALGFRPWNYVEESIQPLRSYGQKSCLRNGDVICFL